MKIKITKCSDPLYWYNKHIGEEFDLHRLGEAYAWVREPDEFKLLNFVSIADFEIVEEVKE